MNAMEDLLQKALQLSETDRLTLAHQLLLSLEPTESEPGCEEAWAAELEARLAKVARGNFAASDWREVVARIRHSLSKEPSP